MTKKTNGQTADGREIDDALINDLAAEAERGYTPEQLAEKPRGRGRPPLGDRAMTVESVRLDPALRAETIKRADADGVTVSEVVRRALSSTRAVPDGSGTSPTSYEPG